MTTNFNGKSALITGAGSGIGRATALAFAMKGANVVVNDINAEGGNETVRMIKEIGSNAIFVKADVSKTTEVQELINQTIRTYNRLDYAFNNAGVEERLCLRLW